MGLSQKYLEVSYNQLVQASLPDLKSHEGLKILKEAGYGFTGFDRPQNFKMQAEILDLAVKTAGDLTSETAVISDVAHLVLDSLFDSPRGFEFSPGFLKKRWFSLPS